MYDIDAAVVLGLTYLPLYSGSPRWGGWEGAPSSRCQHGRLTSGSGRPYKYTLPRVGATAVPLAEQFTPGENSAVPV